MVRSFWLNLHPGGCSRTRVMTICVFYVGPHFPNIRYFNVCGGIWRYINLFGGIWRCMEVYGKTRVKFTRQQRPKCKLRCTAVIRFVNSTRRRHCRRLLEPSTSWWGSVTYLTSSRARLVTPAHGMNTLWKVGDVPFMICLHLLTLYRTMNRKGMIVAQAARWFGIWKLDQASALVDFRTLEEGFRLSGFQNCQNFL